MPSKEEISIDINDIVGIFRKKLNDEQYKTIQLEAINATLVKKNQDLKKQLEDLKTKK